MSNQPQVTGKLASIDGLLKVKYNIENGWFCNLIVFILCLNIIFVKGFMLMDSKYVVDPKTKQRYFYLTSIYSKDVEAKVAALPTIVKIKDGYLLPRIPSNYQIVRELSYADGGYKIKDEREKKRLEYQKILDEKAPDYAVANEILRCILNKKQIQGFADSCPHLMNHQKGGTIIAERFDKYAFFYDTGTGKTLMALDIIRRKAEKNDAHFLILCPKTIINTAWIDDGRKFYPKLRVLPLSNNISSDQLRRLVWQWRKNDVDFHYDSCFFEKTKRIRDEKSREYMLSQADHIIVNFEMFNRDPDKYMYISSGSRYVAIDGIIVDESSVLKSGSSMLYSNLRDVVEKYNIKYLYLFSGKPAPNKIQEYYPQIHLVAPYLKLPSISDIEKGGLKYERELMESIKKASITVSKKDCFDLPETTEIIRKVELDDNLRRQYASLAHQFITELQALEQEGLQNKIVYVSHVLASISKLRQFTGGFVINDDDTIHVHSKKLDELRRIVEELGGQQAIIWCQYQHEVRAIEKMLIKLGYSVVTAYGGTKDKDASINAFKNGDATFIIAHPRTLQYGVTLTNCCYAIYYTTSYSFEEYYQSHDRIYRKGQTLPCTYIFIQADDTIDEVMFKVITEKKNNAERTELFLKHMKDAAQSR